MNSVSGLGCGTAKLGQNSFDILNVAYDGYDCYRKVVIYVHNSE